LQDAVRVLIVGGGGREHALVWAIARDRPHVELICAPGNAGTEMVATNVPASVGDAIGLSRLAREREVDLVVIGPDAAAAAGVADACLAAGIRVFGPTATAARIESSKSFAKGLMDAAGIPTARWMSGGVEDLPALRGFVRDVGGACAVKADGLALGKGVEVCADVAQADAALDGCLLGQRFGAAGTTVVVEERLEGRELSVLALSDGERLRLLVPARDYKRADDGDRGANTGGMGAVAPPLEIDTAAVVDAVRAAVLQPCVDEMRDRGMPFRGCLYAGLMLTSDGVRVLEFNARFGDPEAQVTLPLLDEPLLDILIACADGGVEAGVAPAVAAAAVGVVITAQGYPGESRTGDVITGVDTLDAQVLCFHAGTRRDARGLVTAGGRVLCVVGMGSQHEEARARAYGNVDRINFDGMRVRRDVGAVAVTAS
jgi:phosphoribosylamine---glycine ligase